MCSVAADDGSELLLEALALVVGSGRGRSKGKVVAGIVVQEAELETDLWGALLAAEEGWAG